MATATSAEKHQIPASLKAHAVAIDTLTFDPANARKHNDRNLDAIKGSLARFGQQKPIVIDANGCVIAGNGTLEAARALGWTHIAAVTSTLTGADRVAFGIADNRTAELADWDHATLSELLDSFDDPTEAIPGLDDGFLQEIDAMTKGVQFQKAPEVSDDDAGPMLFSVQLKVIVRNKAAVDEVAERVKELLDDHPDWEAKVDRGKKK